MLPSKIKYPKKLGTRFFRVFFIVFFAFITSFSPLFAPLAEASQTQSGHFKSSAHIQIGDSGMDSVTLGEIRKAATEAQIDAQQSGQTSTKIQILKFAAGGIVGVGILKLGDLVQGCQGCNDMYFSPTLTLSSGFPVYQDNNSTKKLVFPMPDIAPRAGARWQGTAAPPDSTQAVITLDYEQNGTTPDDKDHNGVAFCSMEKWENCWENTNGGKQVNTFSAADKAKLSKIVSKTKTGFANTKSDVLAGDSCGGGALNFILCPIKKLLDDANAAMLKVITEELVVHTSQFSGSQGLKDGFNAILGLANGLFALIFLIMIFGNSLSLGGVVDNYTIKKVLPRFVAAVLLAQFSFYLAGAIIEVGNVLGVGITNTLFGASSSLSISALDANGIGGSTAGTVASILVELSFLLISLIAALIGIFVLAVRQIILVGIMVTGPIAFAAMVLPGTKKAFDLWWDNLIKLSLMFPLMVGLLGGSLWLKNLINNSNSNWIVQFGAAALPILALLYLPRTLKMSGKLMAAGGGAIAGIGTKAVSKGVVQPIKGASKEAIGNARQNAGARLAASDRGLAKFGAGVVAGNLGAGMPGRRGNAQRQRLIAGRLAEEKKLEELKHSTMSGAALAAEAEEAGKNAALRPNDVRAQARLQSVIARANGLSDYNAVARANSSFYASAPGDKKDAVARWGNAVGSSGAFGDINEKAPDVLGSGTFSFDAAGSRTLTSSWGTDDEVDATGAKTGGKVLTGGTPVLDVSKRGRAGLQTIQGGVVKHIATMASDPTHRAEQLSKVRIEEIAAMATDSRYAPKDPGAKEHWVTIARQMQTLHGAGTKEHTEAQHVIDSWG